jgi:hypothetical protein
MMKTTIATNEYSARAVIDQLVRSQPVRIDDLSNDSGIFLLLDHEGRHQFVGFASAPKGFHDRIFSRHCAGDESHKYSKYYNVGRMWRSPNAKIHTKDAMIAKKLRTAFCRRYCRVALAPLNIDRDALKSIAAEIELAERSFCQWNDCRPTLAIEPKELVDSLLAELAWDSDEIAAVERQEKLSTLEA